MDAEYLAQRERLIAEDRQLRVDALASVQATDAEKKADEIVRKLRAEENETVWGPNAPPIPGSLHLFPGMGFLTGPPCSLGRLQSCFNVNHSPRDNLEHEAVQHTQQGTQFKLSTFLWHT